jgi:hypothetical protein
MRVAQVKWVPVVFREAGMKGARLLEAGQPIALYAAERLVNAIGAVVDSARDPKTLSRWGRSVGASQGTLRGWARAAHVKPSRALDFARLLRVILTASRAGWDLPNLLDITDDRTFIRMFARGEIPDFLRAKSPPTLREFMARQQFVRDAAVLTALDRWLADRSTHSPGDLGRGRGANLVRQSISAAPEKP